MVGPSSTAASASCRSHKCSPRPSARPRRLSRHRSDRARLGRRRAKHRRDFPGFAETFLVDGERAASTARSFRNAALADTLEQIAAGGRDAFYRGDIARTIDAFMREVGGFLRYEDLAEHRSEWVEPVSVNYRGYDVWELPPNGQGIAALQMLQILKGFDLRSAGFGSPDHLHCLVEAKKLAFEDRARFYADPAFAKPPVDELISPPYADKRRALIDPATRRHDRRRRQPRHRRRRHRSISPPPTTTATWSRSSRATIRGFGSGLCPPGLGFCLQNRGELFDLTPGRPNSYAPGKRPFHTIIPAILTKDGRPVMSFGVMGGDMQPQGHVQILVNLLDFDMGLQEAGDAPRVHHIGSTEPTGEPAEPDGGEVQLESGFPPETVRELVRRGHQRHGRPAERIRRLPGHLVRRRKGRLLRRHRVAQRRRRLGVLTVNPEI